MHGLLLLPYHIIIMDEGIMDYRCMAFSSGPGKALLARGIGVSGTYLSLYFHNHGGTYIHDCVPGLQVFDTRASCTWSRPLCVKRDVV